MLEPRDPHRLATARDLSRYHGARDRLYLAAAELLARPPSKRGLDTIDRTLWAGGASCATLRAALPLGALPEAAEAYARLFAGATPAVSLECTSTSVDVQHAAHAEAGLTLSDRTSELTVLARLAALTSRALASNELLHASELCDLQVRFLDEHAARCLGELADGLIGSGSPFYAAIGGAIATQVAEDLRLLSSPA